MMVAGKPASNCVKSNKVSKKLSLFLVGFCLSLSSAGAPALLEKVWNPRLMLERPQPKGDFKKLDTFPEAGEIGIARDFNGWQEQGFRLYRSGELWRIKLHLPRGKNRYKLIVDGEWILDPSNPTWEGNEYGSGNSVVWVP